MADRKSRAPRRPTNSGKGRRPRRPRTSVPATGSPLAVAAEAFVGDPIVLNSAPTYIAFACLFAFAALLVFARWLVVLVVIIAVAVAFFRVLFWLCERYPRTMFVITCIARGFFSRR
jgi:hypothetical protein